MKKILFAILLLQSFFSFSQDLITSKRGKVFNANNEKLKPAEVRDFMATNPEALKLYNAGKAKQTWGNILLLSGFSVVAINHYSLLKESDKNNGFRPNRNIPYIVGAGIVLVAIPIKIGFAGKIKKSVKKRNENSSNPIASFTIESCSFIVNANRIGVSLNF